VILAWQKGLIRVPGVVEDTSSCLYILEDGRIEVTALEFARLENRIAEEAVDENDPAFKGAVFEKCSEV
jgi:hypothetical protein